jgi:hypothetical protein
MSQHKKIERMKKALKRILKGSAKNAEVEGRNTGNHKAENNNANDDDYGGKMRNRLQERNSEYYENTKGGGPGSVRGSGWKGNGPI